MQNNSLNSKVDLINQYNHFKLKAHSLFMQGLKVEASEFYELAFETNKVILNNCLLDESCIKRSLDSCLDCLDFCICDENINTAYFLNETSNIFVKILEKNYEDEIKYMTLISYSKILNISENLEYSSCYSDTNTLASTFKNLCFKNSYLITSFLSNNKEKDFYL